LTHEPAVINLAAVREHSRKELLAILDSIPSPKALVLDPKLVSELGLVASVPVLKEHGVKFIYQLLKDPLTTECKSVVYLVRPTTDNMDMIASQVRVWVT
jgi:hypothetical protein